MTLGSGMAAQIGYALETTAGTPVAPAVYLPLISETLMADRQRLESAGIIAGRRMLTSDQWSLGNIVVSGDVQHELLRRNLGKLFTAMFGGVATTGSGPYTHTFTPDDLNDVALTVQVGVPQANGTVFPKTMAGMKVDSWEIGASAGQIATLGVTYTGMKELGPYRVVTDGVTTNTDATITSATAAFTDADVGTPISGTGIPAGAYIATVTSATSAELSAVATADGTGISFTIGMALGSASYTSGIQPFTFTNGAITLGGSSANVKSFTLSGKNTLDADRRFLGGNGMTAEPLEAGLREYSGTMTVEFNDTTNYERYRAASEVALAASFIAGTDSLSINGNIRLDGETPKVGGKGIVTQTANFKCVASGADSTGITAVLVNGDSTP